MPAISVIIPARDCAVTLPATLTALAGQVLDEEFEVIVVDDASTDATVAAAMDHPVGPRVIRLIEGGGAAAARNAGAVEARGEVLAFTDADCEPVSGWLAAGLRAVASADLVQGRVAPTPGVAVGPYDRSLWVGAEHGLYETANIFVRRSLFERLGGFEDSVRADERHDGWRRHVPARPFGEDTWFGWRARRSGARTVFSEEAAVHHTVFHGDARGYLTERVRMRLFPHLVRRIPELRQAFLWRSVFLHERSAAFDVAAVSFAIAALRRQPTLLVAVVPYLWLVRKEVRKWGGTGTGALKLAAVTTAGDAIGAAALVVGSLEARTPVL